MSKFSSIITFMILVICFLQTAQPKKMKNENKSFIKLNKLMIKAKSMTNVPEADQVENYCESDEADNNETPEPKPDNSDQSSTEVNQNNSDSEGGDGKSTNFDINI